jgi:predicted nucleotidyltransferase
VSGPDNIISQVVQAAQSVFKVKKILLFGSRVAGTNLPDSDYDFLIVADTLLSPGARIDAIRKQLLHLTIPLDIIVVSPDEYNKLVTWSSSIVSEAATTGEVLFEAA